MPKTADLFLPKFNRTLKAKLINQFCRVNSHAYGAAVLAQELYRYLANISSLEKSFYTIWDLNDYSKYMFKYLVSNHLIMLEKKLEAEGLPLMSQYFHLYFNHVLLETLLEETIYLNVHFEDFRDYLKQDFSSIFSYAGFYFPRAPIFARYAHEKFEKYTIAHSNYLMELNLSELLSIDINYGFTPKLAA